MSKYYLLQDLKTTESWTELGTLSNFLTSIVAKHQKIERDPLGNFFRKKSHNAEKN